MLNTGRSIFHQAFHANDPTHSIEPKVGWFKTRYKVYQHVGGRKIWVATCCRPTDARAVVANREAVWYKRQKDEL